MTEDSSSGQGGETNLAEQAAEATDNLSQVGGHLVAIKGLREEIQAHADEIKKFRDAAVILLEEAKREVDASKAAAQAVALAQEKATTGQGVIESKTTHIQNVQTQVDEVSARLNKILLDATESATKAEAAKGRAISADEEIKIANAAITSVKTVVEDHAGSVKNFLQGAQQAEADCKVLADRAADIDKKLAGYENKLADLLVQAEKQHDRITSLLPGATSAGLASAFDKRATSFQQPKKRWQAVFVISLLLLIALGVSGIWHAVMASTVLTYDELIRLWLMRLPVAGALLWLTLHAARETALAKRLEEDYGYKSAIAASFEGFNQEMSKVEGRATEGSPLRQLCANTLATIASPPGRIYDRHRLTVSPAHEAAIVATAVAKALRASPAPNASAKADPE